MNTRKYLRLSSLELSELENKYQYIANEYDIKKISPSIDRACLKETLKIAGMKNKNELNGIEVSEKRLFEKRQFAVNGKE